MSEVRIVEIKQNIMSANEHKADEVRDRLREEKTFLLNLMSSPGSGKTTLLRRTAEFLQGKSKLGVIEADIDSAVDAEAMQEAGVPSVQLHTGGMCHLDADMTEYGLDAINSSQFDILVLENVGNLVCPAEFDTGASNSAMILSVPEGDDKPLKYPLMFTVADVVLINKIDCLELFDFDLERVTERIHSLKPDASVIPVCAKTGEGIEVWGQWLMEQAAAWNRQKE